MDVPHLVYAHTCRGAGSFPVLGESSAAAVTVYLPVVRRDTRASSLWPRTSVGSGWVRDVRVWMLNFLVGVRWYRLVVLCLPDDWRRRAALRALVCCPKIFCDEASVRNPARYGRSRCPVVEFEDFCMCSGCTPLSHRCLAEIVSLCGFLF